MDMIINANSHDIVSDTPIIEETYGSTLFRPILQCEHVNVPSKDRSTA